MRKIFIPLMLMFFIHAVNATTILTDPLRTINTSLTPGNNFTIYVNVTDVADLGGYEFKLKFNNSILNATSIKSINPIWDCYKYQINNSDGLIEVACVLDSPLAGNVKLERIDFSIISVGDSDLDLFDTVLGDSQGTAMPHDVIDGFFSNNPSGVCIKNNPTVTPSPESKNGTAGSTFSFNITVNNNDNNYCEPSIFELSLSCPSNWSCSLNRDYVLIPPQQNDSLMLTVISNKSASPGNYSITVRASNNTYTGVASANVTIIPTPGNKTWITAGCEPCSVKTYEKTILWCDYRNATSDEEITGANITFEVFNSFYISSIGVYNPSKKRYEFFYNSTHPGWSTVRCKANASDYEPNFATFYLVTCGRSGSLQVTPVSQLGVPGSTLTYQIEIYNPDIQTYCNGTVYNLTVDETTRKKLGDWNFALDSNIFFMNPATFKYVYLNVTSSPSASPGNYSINLTLINLNDTRFKSKISVNYTVTLENTTEFSGQLTDEKGNPVKANISIGSVKGVTDSLGRYKIFVFPGIYDILFKIQNLIIQDFWLRMLSVNITDKEYNKLIKVTNYTPENKISLIFNITDNQTIQSYSPIKPVSVMKNGTVLQEFETLENLTANFGWFYNETIQLLYIKFDGA